MSFSNNDMYAKTALDFVSTYTNQKLCDYLKKLDQEEKAAQEKEEQEIIEKLPIIRKETAQIVGGLFSISFGALGFATASYLTTKISTLVLAGPVFGISIGVASAIGILLSKDICKITTIKELNINSHRSYRLYDKINSLTERILTIDPTSIEYEQLKTTKTFFENKLCKYQLEYTNPHENPPRIVSF